MTNQDKWKKHCHDFGVSRIKIAEKAKTQEDWKRNWVNPRYRYNFKLGPWWKMTIEYKVDDFPAEVGFFTDILGFPTNALGNSYAMFTSPSDEFHISIIETPKDQVCTPDDAIKIEFMVKNIAGVTEDLRKRGIRFEKELSRSGGKDSQFISGSFRTPNNIKITLWSVG